MSIQAQFVRQGFIAFCPDARGFGERQEEASRGNILASSSSVGRDLVARLRYEIELGDPGQVNTLLASLRGVDSVFDAYRLLPRAT